MPSLIPVVGMTAKRTAALGSPRAGEKGQRGRGVCFQGAEVPPSGDRQWLTERWELPPRDQPRARPGQGHRAGPAASPGQGGAQTVRARV